MGEENERIGKTKQAKMLKQAVIKIEVTLLPTRIELILFSDAGEDGKM